MSKIAGIKSENPSSEEILNAVENLLKALKNNRCDLKPNINSLNKEVNKLADVKTEKIDSDEIKILEVVKRSNQANVKIENDEIEIVEIVRKGDKPDVEHEIIHLEDDADNVKQEKDKSTEDNLKKKKDDSSQKQVSITSDEKLDPPRKISSKLLSNSLKRVRSDPEDRTVVTSSDEVPGPSQADSNKAKTGEKLSRLNWYPKERALPIFLPLAEKERIVNLKKQHPSWSYKKIQEYTGCGRLDKNVILSWEKKLKRIPNENVLKINEWVQKKIATLRKANVKITDAVLYDLGEKANDKLPVGYSWPAAGPKWLDEFKETYNFVVDQEDSSSQNSKN